MKSVSQFIITTIYLTMLMVLSVKVVETVSSGSVLISRGSNVKQLEAEKRQLEHRQQQLKQELASARSLQSVDQSLLAEYAQIDQPIVLTVPSTVASR